MCIFKSAVQNECKQIFGSLASVGVDEIRLRVGMHGANGWETETCEE